MNSWSLLTLALLLGPGAATALAGSWCVPNAFIGGACPNVAATVQAAVTQALPRSIVKVGPGTPPEKITITKRLTIQCLPGALLTDAGLPPGGTMITYAGEFAGPAIKSCTVQVARSAVGIAVPHGVSFFKLDRSTLERVGPRAGTGLLVDGRGGPNHAKRAKVIASTISGFDVGGDFYDVAWLNLESLHPQRVVWQDNNVGVRCRNCQGQIFYDQFIGNGIGLHIATINTPAVGQIDINSNVFGTPGVPGDANAVAVKIDRCSMWHNEFNHSDIYESPVVFRVETDAGSVDGDRAYSGALVRFAQFADTLVCHNGECVTHDSPAFSPIPAPECLARPAATSRVLSAEPIDDDDD